MLLEAIKVTKESKEFYVVNKRSSSSIITHKHKKSKTNAPKQILNTVEPYMKCEDIQPTERAVQDVVEQISLSGYEQHKQKE